MEHPKEGSYRTVRDVPAPMPDKRKTSDWRAQPIAAGTIFHIALRYGTWSVWSGKYAIDSITLFEPECDALLAALEPIPDTPRLLLARENMLHGAARVLDKLYAKGLVTLPQVREAFDEWMNEPEE